MLVRIEKKYGMRTGTSLSVKRRMNELNDYDNSIDGEEKSRSNTPNLKVNQSDISSYNFFPQGNEKLDNLRLKFI
jgi:hypothetical protein